MQINIRINGRDYQLACDDGQEERLRLLAEDVDGRVRQLSRRMGGQAHENVLLLLTAVTMADEMRDLREEAGDLRAQVSQFATLVDEERYAEEQTRLADMESAMAHTLEEISIRIERIADQLELR